MAINLEIYLEEQLTGMEDNDPDRRLFQKILKETKAHVAMGQRKQQQLEEEARREAESSEEVRSARARLMALVEDRVPINIFSPAFLDGWQNKKRLGEISQFGDEAVVHLIPIVKHVHGTVLSVVVMNNEIHTRHDLSIKTDEEIMNLRGHFSHRIRPVTAQLIIAMRDLAIAQLAPMKT